MIITNDCKAHGTCTPPLQLICHAGWRKRLPSRRLQHSPICMSRSSTRWHQTSLAMLTSRKQWPACYLEVPARYALASCLLGSVGAPGSVLTVACLQPLQYCCNSHSKYFCSQHQVYCHYGSIYRTCKEAERCSRSLHCSIAHATALSWPCLVASWHATSQTMHHPCSASLPGPCCDANCGVAHILLLCTGIWCMCTGIRGCMYAEDARWNSTARGHQCAPHGRPLNRQVPVPQVCCQDCKPLALCSICPYVLFCVLSRFKKTLCACAMGHLLLFHTKY